MGGAAMNGLNHDAVAEMLAEYFKLRRKIDLMKHSVQFLITDQSRQNVPDRIRQMEADRDFLIQVLQDEFVLGLRESMVAKDYGIVVNYMGNLAVA